MLTLVRTKELDGLARNRNGQSASSTRLRVLCLHGFRMNKTVMEHQTRDLRAILGPNAEFVYLNAPHMAAGDSYDAIEKLFAGCKPFREWWQLSTPLRNRGVHNVLATYAAHDMTDLDPENEWYTIYEGIEHTIAHLDQEIKALGPFDIVVGFSQATVLLTTLTMWYHLKRQQQCPWKLSILVGGMRVRGKNVRSLFQSEDEDERLVPTPSIHIIGMNDPLFEEGLKLAQMYDRWDGRGSTKRLVLFHGCDQQFPTARLAPNVYKGIREVVLQLWPRFVTNPNVLETHKRLSQPKFSPLYSIARL